ncbi:MAG TPA: isoprenylcysteine carboxylmethyltransferase family protein [Bryobacteraceae bacterium]|nr:isoprenylcysteine carboxylmethyltransferase family protein [Bryobacteraceae bacterium]
MYSICRGIIDIAWMVFLLVWLLASFSSKSDARRQSSGSRLQQALPVLLAYFLLFNRGVAIGPLGLRFVPAEPFWWILGAVLTLAGILIAFWARFFLGRNWSATVTVKQDHELVRSGPYAIVRHPIYSGLLLSILGTALFVGEVRGLLALLLALLGWKWKSLQEESFMQEQFGESYSIYRRQVKALIPFVW